jgi:sugar O-acyltransferase (sialic acid O-acetyltransferase NeuD family)
MQNLILIGGGGHCISVIDVIDENKFNILGILDLPENVGEEVLGRKIIGTDDNIADYVNSALFVVTLGFLDNDPTPTLRTNIYNKVIEFGGKFATIISPHAYVSKYAIIEEGTVVMHKACINANAHIGKNCIINTFANIEHNCTIGDHATISTGAMINGDCIVGSLVFIGSQCVLSDKVIIPNNTIIGSNSFVNKSLPTSGIYWGTPAKKAKSLLYKP